MASSASLSFLQAITAVTALTYNVPPVSPPTSSGPLSAAPVGLSIEFFAYPGYFNSVNATSQCLENLKDLSGTWPRVRIGGTTQDRATYDQSLTNDVNYTVASPADAPLSLTYGPSFFSRAATYQGAVTVGLNRELDQLENTITAANVAKEKMCNLEAIELGNEPNLFTSKSPIAKGQSWTAERDYASQISWQVSVGQNLSTRNIFQAGVYLEASGFTNKGLAAVENNTASQYVKTFDSHHYPQSGSTSNLSCLMDHAETVTRVAKFKGEVDAAQGKGKVHVFGETNSGSEALFFHQGTIGNCQYCWWGRYSMGAPYYGAYFATQALSNVSYISQLDDGSTRYAAYALYDESKALARVLLYNSDYYTSGTRPAQSFTLTGLNPSSVSATRLTADFATSRQDRGQVPTVGGQSFEDGTCAIKGSPVVEDVSVVAGEAAFLVGASEALLVYVS